MVRWVLCAVVVVSASLVGDTRSSSAQYAEATFVLKPDAGGPTDTFTGIYDVNSGGCRYRDGSVAHFYWFGGASSIAVLGKAPLVNCVASLTTVPPAGTTPGDYGVAADVFSPSGPQAQQGGTYRVSAASRSRSGAAPSTTSTSTSPSTSTSTYPSVGSTATTPAPGRVGLGPGASVDSGATSTGASGLGRRADSGGGRQGTGPMSPQADPLADGSPAMAADSGSTSDAGGTEARPGDCAPEDVACGEAAAAKTGRRGTRWGWMLSTLAAGLGLCAAFVWVRRRRTGQMGRHRR